MDSTIGKDIDRLYELKQEMTALNKQVTTLKGEYAELEQKVLDELREQGLNFAGGKAAKATVAESIVPAVEDWDAFYDYIIETKQPFLLERRPAVGGFRDLHGAGEKVPGVNPFTKVALSLTKIKVKL